MIKERSINKFIKCGWPVKHLFGKYYLIKKYSLLTTGIRGKVWVIRKERKQKTMKVELEYINGQKAYIEDVLDVVFCTYDIEIYHRRDDVTIIETNIIKSVKVTEL